jgi:hypothetical protein
LMAYGIDEVASLAGAAINQLKRWSDVRLISPEVAGGEGRGRRRLYSMWNVFEAAICARIAKMQGNEQSMRAVLWLLREAQHPARLSGTDNRWHTATWRELVQDDRPLVSRDYPIIFVSHALLPPPATWNQFFFPDDKWRTSFRPDDQGREFPVVGFGPAYAHCCSVAYVTQAAQDPTALDYQTRESFTGYGAFAILKAVEKRTGRTFKRERP